MEGTPHIKMRMTNVYLLVICIIIGMANSAVHFDETTNYMKVKKQQPKPGPEMDTVYVPGMCGTILIYLGSNADCCTRCVLLVADNGITANLI